MPGGTGILDTYIGIILIYAWWYGISDTYIGILIYA
jgi:hypothetical protein